MQNPFFDQNAGLKEELAAMLEQASGGQQSGIMTDSQAIPTSRDISSALPSTGIKSDKTAMMGLGGAVEKPDIGPVREALVNRIQNEGSLGRAIGRVGENQLTRSQKAMGLPSTQVGTPSEQGLANQISAYETLVKANSLGSPEAKTMMDALKTFGLEGPDAQKAVEFIASNPEVANSMTEQNVLTTVARVSRQMGLTGKGSAQSSIGKMYADEQKGLIPPGTTQSYVQKQTTLPQYASGQGKPLPPAALKMQNEALDIIGTASGMNADLSAIQSQLQQDKLNLGLGTNLMSRARNAVGASDDNSRNFASFQASLEKLRNDSLRLNKGVQTEGDAVRAWNEILSNITDENLVAQRLGEVQRINQRAAELQQLNVDNIRANYGQQPMDYQGYTNRPAALNGGQQGSYQDPRIQEALDAGYTEDEIMDYLGNMTQ